MTSMDTNTKTRNNPSEQSSSAGRQASFPSRLAETNPRSVSPDRIARRAYEIWERSGRPEGQAEHHWSQAEEELRRS